MDGTRGQARVSARFLVVGLIERRIRIRGGDSRDTAGARCQRVQNARSGRAQSTCTKCSTKCHGDLGASDANETFQIVELGYDRASRQGGSIR